MKTFEEYIEKFQLDEWGDAPMDEDWQEQNTERKEFCLQMAAEILRVAEEWCSEYVETGQVATFDTGNEVVSEPVMATVGEFNSANKLYDFLKSYIAKGEK